MADYLNNVAAGDQYTPACTLGPNYEAKYCVVTIANNSALMQFLIGKAGSYRWTDEREFQSIPQSFRVGGVIGIRVRNAVPGSVARVLAVLAGDDDPDFQSGVPFSGVLSAGGGVTPGAGSVEVDHNGLAISTEPKVDFEDNGAFVWTVSDDVANTRAKVFGPRMITGAVSAAGAVNAGSGFTVTKLGAGNYRVTFNAAFGAAPAVVVDIDQTGAYGGSIQARAADHFDVIAFNTNTQVPADLAFVFFVIGMV